MYLKALKRQMAVCSFDEAMRLTALDKGYWNVVSIHGPRESKARLPQANTICYACFDDVEEEYYDGVCSATADDVADIFNFIRALKPPAAPVLIHCQQGLSRSPAVALSWIYGQLPPTPRRAVKAIDLLVQLRPQAKPNRLVLALGLAQFIDAGKAGELASWMVDEPRLKWNRIALWD